MQIILIYFQGIMIVNLLVYKIDFRVVWMDLNQTEITMNLNYYFFRKPLAQIFYHPPIVRKVYFHFLFQIVYFHLLAQMVYFHLLAQMVYFQLLAQIVYFHLLVQIFKFFVRIRLLYYYFLNRNRKLRMIQQKFNFQFIDFIFKFPHDLENPFLKFLLVLKHSYHFPNFNYQNYYLMKLSHQQ